MPPFQDPLQLGGAKGMEKDQNHLVHKNVGLGLWEGLDAVLGSFIVNSALFCLHNAEVSRAEN